MSQSFETILLDITDTLSSTSGIEDSWAAIVRASEKIGAVALNAGAFTRDTREMIWARSTMEDAWIKEYDANRFHEIDPMLFAIRRGDIPELSLAGLPVPGMAPDPRFPLLRQRLLSYGYAWLWAHQWRKPAYDNVVVMAMQDDPQEMFGPNTADLIRTVSALMAARLSPPTEVDALYGGMTEYRSLTVREKDVMHCLAQGMNNSRIAETLGVAEITVRMHLRNVRQKMGATTREHALALALLRGAF
ncbi:LuxR family transcriptional regulator [Pseudoruegeria sp. SK021]|uniref:helix-turn-helix transcriptional regulator n=1 Tax=Pseudoruegeria sp. SK021 TaxID=1933035 RepID=UPI000A247825|nr:LuxR family transcriptional regulator [Pseudoruegeria sp. SK021]OSP56217.1 hypothetical protein BV911_02685 [Pseudoruegeria sp. SK021]